MNQIAEILPDVDGRALRVRRAKSLFSDWVGEFPIERLTPAQCGMLRRAAVIALVVEESEADFLNYGKKLPGSYFAAVRTLQNLMGQLERIKHYGLAA